MEAPLTTVAYNLENLESVGLVKVERIKYSEKGREVKIYAPVRKLIVVVPEKTDRKSVAEVIRKYLGVILAAVLASGFIEFLTRSAGRSTKMFKITSDSNLMPAPTPAVPAVTSTPAVVNETIKGSGAIAGAVPTSVATAPTSVYASSANATATPALLPPMPEGAVGQAAPDIFTNLANTIAAHPGLLFLMGCLFVVALLMIVDYRRKRKNG